MPQYRFHVFNDDHTIDDQGREFLNLDEARVYAINCIRRIMADELTTRGHIDLRHWIEIEDEHGDMHVVEFREGVTISS